MKLASLAFAVTAALAGFGAVAAPDDVRLTGRAILPADTFAPGPTSGQYITSNLRAVPFRDKQPVQGFSAIAKNDDGTFWVMADNGFGAIENSADFNLRVYRIRPDFKTKSGGSGGVKVLTYIELHDPDHKIPFAIVNHFSKKRVLTGADFDIESMQRDRDGTLWFGDEFGPFLIHTDATGRVLEAPYKLPDFRNAGKEVRSPQNPFSEETAALRIMNAARAHALANGNKRTPVFSAYFPELKYNVAGIKSDPDAQYARGVNSPAELGTAASDIHDVALLKAAGFPVVPYTVNDKPTMLKLMRVGVTGLISDRPDLLLEAVREFDANGDGTPGDYLGADGLPDVTMFDAQGHRGARDLRPENTLPAMEAALDFLMPTLETDTAITRDGVPILKHDPYIEAQKCRRADGQPYLPANQVLIRTLTVKEIQATFVCDKVFRGATQQNDPKLSPVTVAWAKQAGLANIYAMPTLQQVFDFVKFYEAWYRNGPGAGAPDAAKRAATAAKVRFNVETKINPRSDKDPSGNVYRERTVGANQFADAVAGVIVANGLAQRADVQSFDFRTLIRIQERQPSIRTVYLFGDFPIFNGADSDDGTNMQPEKAGGNTPWMAGLYWPYRQTVLSNAFRAARSGGFEGMARTTDGRYLLPLLELPLAGDDAKTLLIHQFDLAKRRYTGVQYRYGLEAGGTNIGDFIMFNRREGMVIERDGSQGNVNGFKKIYRIRLAGDGAHVQKSELVNLNRIADPNGISKPVVPGDIGTGDPFAFPFTTIEDVVIIDERTIGVLNDNNYPFSTGRRADQPDNNEFILLDLGERLRLSGHARGREDDDRDDDDRDHDDRDDDRKR